MSDLASLIPTHYEKHARAWDADRRRLPWADRPWIERFAGTLPPEAAVLDLGCGGCDPVGTYLARRGFRLTGVDAAPTLLALCRARLPQAEFVRADMRTLSLGRRFDGILAWDSFFHLSPADQRAMFSVFAAHVHPGGMLLFNAGPAPGEPVGNYGGDPLYHASLAPAEYHDLLAAHEFVIRHHVANDRQSGGRTAWLAASRLQTGVAAPHIFDAEATLSARARREE